MKYAIAQRPLAVKRRPDEFRCQGCGPRRQPKAVALSWRPFRGGSNQRQRRKRRAADRIGAVHVIESDGPEGVQRVSVHFDGARLRAGNEDADHGFKCALDFLRVFWKSPRTSRPFRGQDP